MKKINNKIIISIIIFLIILSSISIIIANSYNSVNVCKNKEKMYYQIKYLDKTIISMSNSLNLNSDIKWDSLYSDIEKLYNYWNIAILDLNNLDIENSDLVMFGKILDNISISIKNKEKQQFQDNITRLYYQLVIYAQILDYDNNYTNIISAKYHLLFAYSVVEKGNWTIVYENILKADEDLLNVVNSMDNSKYSQYNINQAYVAIKEMENIINIKDLNIFNLKYSIALTKIENI